jgi:adiponectin receptor
VNIWSHLLGFFVFLGLYVYSLVMLLSVGLVDAALVISVFMIGVMVCMLCSATFHLFLCHSEKMYHRLLRADLIGPLLDVSRLAVNCEYVPWDTPLREGDEVVVITPVSGG